MSQRLMRAILRRLCVLFAALAACAAYAQDIVVGQVGPFTVLPVPDAHEVNQGIKAYFAQVNARGGIGGRRISFFEIDDKYAPDPFVTAFNEAMQRRPVALLSPIGSAALKRMLDAKLLDSADVVVLNAIPGVAAFREPGHPRLFHIRASDREQIATIVHHVQTLGIRRLTVLYQKEIPMGSSGLADARNAAVKGGGVVAITGVQSTMDIPGITAAAKQIVASDAQAIAIVGAPRYSADCVVQLRKAGASQSIFVLSYVLPTMLVKVAGEAAAHGVRITETYPNPMGVSLPLQREFHAAMHAAFPAITNYTSFHLEGYISARVLVEALRRTRSISPEALAHTLSTMGDIDLGGWHVQFDRHNVGSHFVDIGIVTTGGKLMY